MPAFDPVRDAVLNSPLIPSSSYTSPVPNASNTPAIQPMHIDLPVPTRSSSSSSYTDTPSTSVSASTPRRATSLSMLLNDPEPDYTSAGQDTPLFTPTTPRAPSHLSHLLHPNSDQVEEREQLTHLAPLRRRQSDHSEQSASGGGASASNREGSYFSWSGPYSSSRSSASASDSPHTATSLAFPGSLPTPREHPSSHNLYPHSSAPTLVSNPSPHTRSPVTPTLSNIVSPGPTQGTYGTLFGSRPSSSHSSRPSTANASAPQRSASGSMSSGMKTGPSMPPPPHPHPHGLPESHSQSQPQRPATPPPSFTDRDEGSVATMPLSVPQPTSSQSHSLSFPSPPSGSPAYLFHPLPPPPASTNMPPPQSSSVPTPVPTPPPPRQRSTPKPKARAAVPEPASMPSRPPTSPKPSPSRTSTPSRSVSTSHPTLPQPPTNGHHLPAKPEPSSTDELTMPIKRSSVPYAPTRRITPATSVLVPLSPAEMARYRNFPGGVGTMILKKRKRERMEREQGVRRGQNADANGGTNGHAGEEDRMSGLKRERSASADKVKEEDDGDERDVKRRRTGDVGLVVEHYNARPDVGVTQRQESPIIGLKNFNNWVKSVLITRFAHPALSESPESEPLNSHRGGRGGGQRGRVLDLGCGKGGDLTKWSKARVKEYVGVDIAAISVDQARLRHASTRSGPRFTASFFALDCYAHALRDALPPAVLAQPFDVVSMQFCMHYAFESESKARCMLANVAHNLRRGGVFIGTIPDAGQLLHNLDKVSPDAEEFSFGNSVYKIRFEDRTQRPLFGHRYWFFLKDAVDDVPEYVVQWDNFVRMAAEYGLYPTYKKEFHQIFEEHHEHAEFGPLLVRMRVVDANGESHMDEDQWEAANIYIGFAFEKR